MLVATKSQAKFPTFLEAEASFTV